MKYELEIPDSQAAFVKKLLGSLAFPVLLKQVKVNNEDAEDKAVNKARFMNEFTDSVEYMTDVKAGKKPPIILVKGTDGF